MSTAPRNDRLWALLEQYLIGDQEGLYAALIEREDEALDGLRIQAAQHGLMPSITSVILLNTHLGTPPTVEQAELLNRQVQDELAELQRRMNGGE